MRFGTGYRQCAPDAIGTHGLEHLLGGPVQADALPNTLDLNHLVRVMRNQGRAGTCVGFGLSQAIMNCARQLAILEFATDDVSAQSTYVQARASAGLLKDPIDGVSLSDALPAIGLGGYQMESECPYRPDLRNQGLHFGEGQRGLRRCGLRYHRLDTARSNFESAVKQALVAGKGIVGGWLVDDAFERWTSADAPFDGGQDGEGHCMCLLDFPQAQPRLVNSWGEDMGDKGFFTVTWNFVRRAMALWVVDFVPLPVA